MYSNYSKNIFCFGAIPHMNLPNRLCIKGLRHVRDVSNPSHIGHFSLTSTLTWHTSKRQYPITWLVSVNIRC